jgi:hypothetical protein
MPASTLGGLTGAVLLLALPSSYFKKIVVVLIVIALVLVVLQPRLSAFVQSRAGEGSAEVRPALVLMVAATGVYGGYFGAAQGIILIAILGVMINDHLQRLNATKNALAGTVNLVASVVFIFATEVDWKIVALIAAGSVIGGQVGSTYGRRLDTRALRAVIVIVGLVALFRLL